MNKSGIISELKRGLSLVIPFFESEPAFLQKSYAPGKWNVKQILAHLTTTYADQEVTVLAPVVRGRKGFHKEVLAKPRRPV